MGKEVASTNYKPSSAGSITWREDDGSLRDDPCVHACAIRFYFK